MAFGVRIIGTGSYLPGRAVRNRELARKLKVSPFWIEERTGIRNRFFSRPGERNVDLAIRAAKRALQAARITAQDVDAVFATTLTPDRAFPGLGCEIQAHLHGDRIPAFDLGGECNGFLFGLLLIYSALRSGAFRRVLFVSSEINSRYLDLVPNQKDLSVLFGDGAGAVVLERMPLSRKGRMSFELHTDGHFSKDLSLEVLGNQGRRFLDRPFMNKTSVIFHSSRRMAEVADALLRRKKIPLASVDFIIPHQSNLNLIREMARRLDVSMNRIIVNIGKVGNTSSASIPIALDQAVRSGRIRRGNCLLLVSFGAGFSWGACCLTY